ncbi:D-2-hydroxyacid dehydrogenase [Vibrio sonorensis]|uniref:D-2-hydroxyacid dehydrogenase n=1 Tax=Vibrio sonorensis TaxID=1004316 RepID=UPI0008D90B22|nr:D-2-hydroxyacid dehydrogenase [Vibrio sonorensis]
MDNAKHKLYIKTEHNKEYQQLVEQQALPDLEITKNPDEASILLASPPLIKDSLDQFANLDWVQSVYAGVDALIAASSSKEYTLTNVKGIFGQQISEYVLGYVISHQRHFALYAQQQAKREWQPHLYTSLNNQTLVVLGTGSIGAYLAEKAGALGLKTIGINRSGIPPRHSPFSEVFHIQEIEKAFNQADIIVNTLPSTEQTYHLLNQTTLAYAHNALLFNVGRGSVLDQSVLTAVLDAGHIAHAFLDVFEYEPLDKTSELWSHPSVTITPHIAALSFPTQVVEIFAENYLLWRDGFSLNNQVSFSKGY